MTNQNLPKLAFIGLGVMGREMALHLAAAGYPLNVFDISLTAVDALGKGRNALRQRCCGGEQCRDRHLDAA